MKYLISLVLSLLVLTPVAKAATLYGFLDGNEYDSNGTWQCLFLMDGNCYNAQEQILMTRPTSTPVSITIPQSTPQTTYVPVYLPPTSSPITEPTVTSSPIVGGESLLPAYTEYQLAGVLQYPYGFRYNITSNSINFYPTGGPIGGQDWINLVSNLTITLDNNLVWSQQLNPSQPGSWGVTPYGFRTYIEVDNLSSGQHTLEYTYTESGRQDTVITKSFTTN